MSANFVILRRCYFDLTNDHCAAKLIEYFSHWTRWKVKHHRTNWIYMPLRQIYADLMGEHSQNVIRNAIQLLIDNGWLQRRHNPGNGQDRTWQYCLNFENIQKALKQRNVNSEVPIVKNDRTLPVDPPRRSDPQQTTAVAFNENDQEEEEFAIPADVVRNIEDSYREELTKECVVSSIEDVELLEANQELDSLLDEGDLEDQYSAPQLQKCDNIPQPTAEEFNQAINELRSIPVTPAITANETIRAAIKKHWGNVPEAIAYLKEAAKNWKVAQGFNWQGLFVAACKEGRKPEKQQQVTLPQPEYNPPTTEQMAQLEQAQKEGRIADIIWSAMDNCTKVRMPKTFKQMPWWEFLGSES